MFEKTVGARDAPKAQREIKKLGEIVASGSRTFGGCHEDLNLKG
jgi:hypothetical protein